jgi:glycosyltransferase involved in cell wall biosynthesis
VCLLADYGPTAAELLDACERATIPLVARFHGYDAYQREVLARFREGYARLFQQAAALIAVSSDMKDQLIRLGASPSRVHWIPSGTDMKLFRPGDPKDAPPHFLAVGRFIPKKAPELSLAAFAKVAERVPDARLTMMGDGPLRDLCVRTADALGLGARVRFPGSVDHEMVRAAMQQCRAFVQHSVKAGDGDSEGTPNAVVEAHASGLPVVATAHAGIRDVVVHGETGFLVPEGDVAGMATAMMELVRSPQRAGEMGRAGRRHVMEAFSLERSLRMLGQVLEEASLGRLMPDP